MCLRLSRLSSLVTHPLLHSPLPLFPLIQPLSLKDSNPSLVASLAALVLSDSGSEITAENITSVIEASGNKVPAYYAPLFASMIEKAGGVEKFLAGPSAGGAAPSGAAPAAAGAAPAAKAAEKPKEEEVDALDGGMDMFGTCCHSLGFNPPPSIHFLFLSTFFYPTQQEEAAERLAITKCLSTVSGS